ncbi:MAG: AAA family ATPase [Pseudomonadota bacterium]
MHKNLGRLNKIEISGYKSIKSLDLKLESLNVLIGSNGVGKSNFISFFKFMKKILDKDLPIYTAEQGGANKLLHFGKKTTSEIEFSLLFYPNAYEAVLIPDVNDRLIFKDEKTSSTARVKQTCNIHDSDTLASDGANLAAFLRFIREDNERSYNEIIRTISRVAPFFQDFILEPEINNKDTIKLKWKHKGTDEYFNANDLSDGTLRFICLTTLLLQPRLPTIILLDEPELGLHPAALNILASMFRKVSMKTQIICLTQSVTLADNFDIEDIIVVDRKSNRSEFKRLNEEEYKDWLEEYSLGEIWQKNIIGGVPTYD